jgi:hypothetical protein
MPILGIMASQISGKLWQPDGAYDSLATVTVGTAVSTVTFAGIPNTYKHLQLRYITRNDTAAYYVILRFNGDSGNNYANHQLSTDGATVSSGGTATTPQIYLPRNATTSQIFGAGVVDILDYANTSKNKTVRGLGGYDANTVAAALDFHSGLWMNTSAVNTITLSAFAGNYAQYSQFSLYGVR